MTTPGYSLSSQEDAFLLPTVYNDPATHASSDHTFCLWHIGGGMTCNTYINVAALSTHLRTHGVKGRGDLVIPCAWDGCTRIPMKRESVVRHVEELHLQVKYVCGQCGASFSRKHTLKLHYLKVHSVTSDPTNMSLLL